MSITPTPETLSQLMDGEWQDIDRSACVAGLCGDEASRARWARLHLARDAMKGEPVLPDGSLADRVRRAIDDEPAYSNVVGLAGGAVPHAGDGDRAGRIGPVDSARPGTAAAPVSWLRGARARSAFTGIGLAATVAIATVTGLSVWQGAPESSGATVEPIASAASTADAASATGEGDERDELPAPVPAPLLPRVETVGSTGSYWVAEAADGRGERSAGEERLNGFLMQHLEGAAGSGREGLLPYSRLVGYDRPVADGAR